MSGIEKSIVKLLGDDFITIDGESRQDNLKRLSIAANKYFDTEGDEAFEKLPDRSQEWLNAATKARKASKPIKEFADADGDEVIERFTPKAVKEKQAKAAKKPASKVKVATPDEDSGEDAGDVEPEDSSEPDDEIEDEPEIDEPEESEDSDEIEDAPEEMTDDEEAVEETPKKRGRPAKADKPAAKKTSKKAEPNAKADKLAKVKVKADPNAPKKRRGRQSTAMDDYVEVRLKNPKLSVDQALDKLKTSKGIELKKTTVLTAENHMQRFVRVAGKIKWSAAE